MLNIHENTWNMLDIVSIITERNHDCNTTQLTNLCLNLVSDRDLIVQEEMSVSHITASLHRWSWVQSYIENEYKIK